jgi:hypothetical protein
VRVFFADKLDTIAVIYDHTVPNHFMFLTVEADNPAALDESFHCLRLSNFRLQISGSPNKRISPRQAFPSAIL